MAGIKSCRDLQVWQKAMDLSAEVYRLSAILPAAEQYRLTSQLLRAVASVPANIAEGHTRATRKDFAHFVSIARGSLAETETLLLLAIRVGLLAPQHASPVLGLCDQLGRQLNVLRQRLVASKPTI
ncbi:MAG TPA: four helix bundle protein [Bauldia sp.]|nr:four helix bundle protein [Bauldia sp.]